MIQHIVLVIQENRSFDNLFQGYPGADTSSTGKTHLGEVVTLTQDPLEAPYDVEHLRDQAVGDIDLGKMDGFDEQPYYPEHPTPPGYTYPPNSGVRLRTAERNETRMSQWRKRTFSLQ